MKKIKPPKNDKEFSAALLNTLATAFDWHKCADCQWPVIRGYCCTYCGSDSPE